MAFIGIRVPENIGKLLNTIKIPGNKESVSEYHITMTYFGKNMPIKEISKILETTYQIFKDAKPFSVKIDEVGCFPKPKNDPCAIIAKIKSDELHELNDKIKEKLDKNDIEYSKEFKEFRPHITLAYADEEIKKFEIEPLHFDVTSLTLWAGDYGNNRLFIDFLLKGPEKEKEASFLMQKSEFFCKIAENIPQDNFTSTNERRINARS